MRAVLLAFSFASMSAVAHAAPLSVVDIYDHPMEYVGKEVTIDGCSITVDPSAPNFMFCQQTRGLELGTLLLSLSPDQSASIRRASKDCSLGSPIVADRCAVAVTGRLYHLPQYPGDPSLIIKDALLRWAQ